MVHEIMTITIACHCKVMDVLRTAVKANLLSVNTKQCTKIRSLFELPDSCYSSQERQKGWGARGLKPLLSPPRGGLN